MMTTKVLSKLILKDLLSRDKNDYLGRILGTVYCKILVLLFYLSEKQGFIK